MLKSGVVEPLRVKTQAISSAAEAAIMILRIDDVIAASKSAAPPGGIRRAALRAWAAWAAWAEWATIRPLTPFPAPRIPSFLVHHSPLLTRVPGISSLGQRASSTQDYFLIAPVANDHA